METSKDFPLFVAFPDWIIFPPIIKKRKVERDEKVLNILSRTLIRGSNTESKSNYLIHVPVPLEVTVVTLFVTTYIETLLLIEY